MCRILRVSRSGYYDYRLRKDSNREIYNQILRAKITDIFEESDGTYGSKRVLIALEKNGETLSRASVARQMKKLGLKSVWKKKFRPRTTVSDSKAIKSDNVINRDFKASGIVEKVGCDITYIETLEGWLYLSVVLDFYSRRVLGYAFSDNLETTLVCESFVKTVGRYRST